MCWLYWWLRRAWRLLWRHRGLEKLQDLPTVICRFGCQTIHEAYLCSFAEYRGILICPRSWKVTCSTCQLPGSWQGCGLDPDQFFSPAHEFGQRVTLKARHSRSTDSWGGSVQHMPSCISAWLCKPCCVITFTFHVSSLLKLHLGKYMKLQQMAKSEMFSSTLYFN